MSTALVPDWNDIMQQSPNDDDKTRLIAEVRQIKQVLSRSAGALLYAFGRLDADGRPVFHHAVVDVVAREMAAAHNHLVDVLVEFTGSDI